MRKLTQRSNLFGAAPLHDRFCTNRHSSARIQRPFRANRRERPRRCRAAEQHNELAPFQVEHPASSPGDTAQKLRLTAQQLQRF
jgi:hypothetical protein